MCLYVVDVVQDKVLLLSMASVVGRLVAASLYDHRGSRNLL